ncbi:MAG: pyridoxal phosphate-dependent aminotransferase family protein [Chitinophagales bacterium]|nr:pyridoxal phosphate-dependent aminotransferase family protein [Chitinophagales bacterium]MCZ2392810.1 pyridoxal phosphate-dependent aminotransferase family protein [Chitinophagales bacterium]
MKSLVKLDNIQERISEALNHRKNNNRYRQLTILDTLIDFRSNDYLGLTKSAWIKQKLTEYNVINLGASGSRLLSGNSVIHEQTEDFLAEFYQSEAALLYNSGFDANVGLLSTLIRPEDIVFYDEAIHASMHQGLKLSGAQKISFKHNDVNDLEHKIQHSSLDNISWMICESYYSMNGDKAPLEQYIQLCKKYNIQIIVDEAHAVGCFGENGRGLCNETKTNKDIFARVVTFGKAIGAHGAAVLCSQMTKEYLINFSKNFIYTTALPPIDIYHIQLAHHFLIKYSHAAKQLHQHIHYFKQRTIGIKNLKGDGPIFSLIVPGEQNVKLLAQKFQNYGMAIQAIISPTIPKGEEQLRIILHSHNTTNEIQLLIDTLKKENETA